MSAKSIRHKMICDLISSRPIETQGELADALSSEGYPVTQATISRDIRELRLIKVMAGDGRYRYATAELRDSGLQERFSGLISNCIVSAEAAGNLVVIKTISASASVAAEAIDSMDLPGVLGTIAGDNTVFVAASDNDNAEKIAEALIRIVKRP